MNKIELLGRLTKDVETRCTQTQKRVSKFSLAVKRRKQEETDFFDVVAWGKTAEFISKYFKKGQQVAVVGRLQNNNYERDGKKYYGNVIVAEEVFFADSKKEIPEPVDNIIEYGQEDPYEVMMGNNEELPF